MTINFYLSKKALKITKLSTLVKNNNATQREIQHFKNYSYNLCTLALALIWYCLIRNQH